MSGETASHWWVKANDKAYGPYTRAQITRFLTEGRVTGTTMVSTRPNSEWMEARHNPALRTALEEARGAFSKSDARVEAPVANMLVWADMVNGSALRFEHELRQLGAVAEIVPGVFIVRTTRTAGTLRNALSQILERGDKLLVIDASRDRLAWFNLGPEVDVRVREVWNAAIAKEAEPV